MTEFTLIVTVFLIPVLLLASILLTYVNIKEARSWKRNDDHYKAFLNGYKATAKRPPRVPSKTAR